VTLTASSLRVSRGGAVLLNDVSLELAPGERVALIGENGAGKSTLLDALAGVRPADSGDVVIEGDSVGALTPRARARRIASLGQRDPAAHDLRVAERIGHGLAPRRGPEALLDDEALAAVRAVAEELAVTALLDRHLGVLSGGERRRVEVARTLVDSEAHAYVLDEPHAGVDARLHHRVSEALSRRAQRGCVVIASMHDLTGALRFADRVVGLAGGRVVLDEPTEAAFTPTALERVFGVRGAVLVGDDGQRGVVLNVE